NWVWVAPIIRSFPARAPVKSAVVPAEERRVVLVAIRPVQRCAIRLELYLCTLEDLEKIGHRRRGGQGRIPEEHAPCGRRAVPIKSGKRPATAPASRHAGGLRGAESERLGPCLGEQRALNHRGRETQALGLRLREERDLGLRIAQVQGVIDNPIE